MDRLKQPRQVISSSSPIQSQNEEIERRISYNVIQGDLGKSDCCILGMLQDRFTVANSSLLETTLQQFISLKHKIVMGFPNESSAMMANLCFELYSSVNLKKQHIILALNACRDELDKYIRDKKQPPFQRASRHPDEHKAFQKTLQVGLTACLHSSDIKQSGQPYKLYLVGQMLNGKLQDPQAADIAGQLSNSLDKLQSASAKADQKYQVLSQFHQKIQKDIISQKAKLPVNNIPGQVLNYQPQSQPYQQPEYSHPQLHQNPQHLGREHNKENGEPTSIVIKPLTIPNQLIPQKLPISLEQHQSNPQINRTPVIALSSNNLHSNQHFPITHQNPQPFRRQLTPPPQISAQTPINNPNNRQIRQNELNIRTERDEDVSPINMNPQNNFECISPLQFKNHMAGQQQHVHIQNKGQSQQHPQSVPIPMAVPQSEQKMLVPCSSSKETMRNQLKNQQDQERNQGSQQSSSSPPYVNEEVTQILSKIPEMTDFERQMITKVYGHYESVRRNENVEKINQKYPDIVQLAKACKCLEKVQNLTVRTVQVLSCILFLMKQKTKGRILQINTGEGKSITVALIAATRALLKDTVDVFTSNKTLAKRDCEEFSEFYKELGLTCGSIGSEEMRSSEPNEEYKKNIVYGDVGSFAADLLGEYYEQRGTRCARLIQFAIVDEVDCMFIDQHNHSTSLAKPIPGLSKLNAILWVIWYKIQQMKDHFLQGYYYYYSPKDQKTLSCKADDFVQAFVEECVFGKDEEKGEQDNYLLNDHPSLKGAIGKSLGPYLRAFAQTQVREWVRNGFYALDLQRGKEYKVEDEKIIPIDFDNTGVAQANTQWRGGLHQFIQMKENVTVTPMSMTVNFVSNVYMFLLYRSQLVGLTGTLGNQQSVSVLEQFYSVDTLRVPPFKPRILQVFPPLVLDSTSSFASAFTEEIKSKQMNGRPVLLICESEKSGKQLVKLLQASFPQVRLIQYYSGDETIEKEALKEFCILISTNLAGRGTDIKLSPEIIQKGGLHVIVAFTPKNKRVEDQAFGRAGRGGQPGSAIIIIDSSKDSFILKQRLTQVTGVSLIEERDKVDAVICEKQLLNMREISKMDDVFWDFCKTLNSCKELKSKDYLRKQEEELWATFYCKIQYMRSDYEKVKQEYEQFKKDFTVRVSGQGKLLNPIYQLNEALRLITTEEFEKAIENCDIVSSQFANSFSAHYLKAVALASMRKHPKGIFELEICEEILQLKDPLTQALQIIQLQSQSLVQQEYNSDLLRQSVLLNRDFQIELKQSNVFESANTITREQLETTISQSGCFKRIKDTEVIRSKLLEHVRDMKEDLKVLMKHSSIGMKLSFIPAQQFFSQDKVQEQVLKEFANEQLPCLAMLKESRNSMLKSLLPLACALFQLANSLYLLQIQGKRDMKRGKVRDSISQNDTVQQAVKGVQVIGDSIRKVVFIGDLDLKDWLSVVSIELISEIQEFQLEERASHMAEVNSITAGAVHLRLMEQLRVKTELIKQVISLHADMSEVAKEMTDWKVFGELQRQSDSFRSNCQQLLSNQNIINTLAGEIAQLDKLQQAMRRQYPYLNSDLFVRELCDDAVEVTAKNQQTQIEENLGNLIIQSYTTETTFKEFQRMVLTVVDGCLETGTEQIIQNMNSYIKDALNSVILQQIKHQINSAKKTIASQMVNNPQQQQQKQQFQQIQPQQQYPQQLQQQQQYPQIPQQYPQQQQQYLGQPPNQYVNIQRKQIDHNERRMNGLRKCYVLMKSDKQLAWMYLQCVEQERNKEAKNSNNNSNSPITINGNMLERAKRQLIKQTNSQYQNEEQSIDTLASLIGGFLAVVDRQFQQQRGFPQELLNTFFKKIADKLLAPVFKSAQHVFLRQIESNAIFALFKHILPDL